MAEPNPGDVLTGMVGALQAFLPVQIPGLPLPSLSLARAELRAAGIGNHIGALTRGYVTATELQALRVEAVARFSLWGFVPADVDQAVTTLTGALFAKRADLAGQGFLKLSFEGSSPAEETKAPLAWRRFADYAMLYETTYDDVGGAAGLIRPVQADETGTGAAWSVTGDLGRWDDTAAPPLSIRGSATITGLTALNFTANPALPPTGCVTLTRTFDGAPAPSAVASLATFLSAVTNPVSPTRNLSVSFTSVAAMLAAFSPAGTPIAMGDRNGDGVPDSYLPSQLAFAAPLVLASVFDRLEFTYADPQFDRAAVLYLRAIRSGG